MFSYSGFNYCCVDLYSSIFFLALNLALYFKLRGLVLREVNLVRGELLCYCGFIANIVDCACGVCREQLLDRDCQGKLRGYIVGHNSYGKLPGNWKGGHPQANVMGYIMEHRVIYEECYECCLLPFPLSHIHHKDGNGFNNEINNLILTSGWEHHSKYHRDNLGQVCRRCGSKNVHRNGISKKGKQKFRCRDCRVNWTVNREHGIDYDQTCQNCDSKHIRRHGIWSGKQVFQCVDCKKCWRIPVVDLMVKRPDNDSRYEECLRGRS